MLYYSFFLLPSKSLFQNNVAAVVKLLAFCVVVISVAIRL